MPHKSAPGRQWVVLALLCLLTMSCENLIKKKDDEEKDAQKKTNAKNATALATASQVLSGREFWDNSDGLQTGTMANRGTLDATTAILEGYYNGTMNSVPDAAAIVSGVTVLGVSGTAPQNASTASRDRSATQLKGQVEANTYAGADLPSGYRDIPDISKDDEGYNGSNIVYATRPGTNCGTSGTLAQRISDCADKNGVTAVWSGASAGNAGQSSWTLVSRVAASKEVWRDDRTNLLWSSVVGSGNWCRASGNVQASDPSNYCNNNANQNQTTPTSFCAEATGLSSAIGGENWTNGMYAESKAGLGKNSTPSVRWRLPTVYDYHQAEIHGLRFVMPDAGSNGGSYEWSQSVVSNGKASAWTYHAGYGEIGSNFRTNSINVRCVGR